MFRGRDGAVSALMDLNRIGVGSSFDDLDSGFGRLEFLTRIPGCRLQIRPQWMARVAEGLEDERQLRFLREEGVRGGAGVLVG